LELWPRYGREGISRKRGFRSLSLVEKTYNIIIIEGPLRIASSNHIYPLLWLDYEEEAVSDHGLSAGVSQRSGKPEISFFLSKH